MMPDNSSKDNAIGDTSPSSAMDYDMDQAIQNVIQSYRSDPRGQHLGAAYLPNRGRTIHVIELLRKVIFPGFFDEHRQTSQSLSYHVGELLNDLSDSLHDQIRQALCYDRIRTAKDKPAQPSDATPKPADIDDLTKQCNQTAWDLTHQFIDCIPRLRKQLILDVQAGFDGDPAAKSLDEIIFCYPGLDAIFSYRIAHELFILNVPLLPRIISEYAHNETGVDIHPGATIGESFFIDHATGVVIGETVIIGNRVKIYQGVTLGALSTRGGQSWRGRKRHPTIEDDVTIYPNVTILGGETVIGARSVINGSVFLVKSVPPDHTVRVNHLEPHFHPKRGRQNGTLASLDDVWSDFNI